MLRAYRKLFQSTCNFTMSDRESRNMGSSDLFVAGFREVTRIASKLQYRKIKRNELTRYVQLFG